MKSYPFIAACFVFVSLHSFSQPFSSRHFTVVTLDTGIYTAIATNGGHAICNAGIIDLGNATLIFDPFMTPEAAEDLKRAAVQLTGHDIKYVVNSHYHNDHIGGNQVFNGADIISTERTAALIAKYQPAEIEDDKKEAAAQFQKLRNKDTTKMTPHEKEENIMWTAYYEALATAANVLKTVLPNKTFKKQLTIAGSKRKVILLSYGTGHTESDLFLYIPGRQIAFLGDLLFIQNQPWLGDGNADKWKMYLDSIAKLHLKITVPGHGPVGSPADFNAMYSYFEKVKNTATGYYKKGALPQNDSTLTSPSPFDSWFLSNFYKPNVISEYERLYKKPKSNK